jgi:hypothetical protein
MVGDQSGGGIRGLKVFAAEAASVVGTIARGEICSGTVVNAARNQQAADMREREQEQRDHRDQLWTRGRGLRDGRKFGLLLGWAGIYVESFYSFFGTFGSLGTRHFVPN